MSAQFGLLSERPASAVAVGYPYFTSDTREFYVWSGTEWLLMSFVSNPPSGKCKVTNFYVDPATGKLVVEYDNNPEP